MLIQVPATSHWFTDEEWHGIKFLPPDGKEVFPRLLCFNKIAVSYKKRKNNKRPHQTKALTLEPYKLVQCGHSTCYFLAAHAYLSSQGRLKDVKLVLVTLVASGVSLFEAPKSSLNLDIQPMGSTPDQATQVSIEKKLQEFWDEQLSQLPSLKESLEPTSPVAKGQQDTLSPSDKKHTSKGAKQDQDDDQPPSSGRRKRKLAENLDSETDQRFRAVSSRLAALESATAAQKKSSDGLKPKLGTLTKTMDASRKSIEELAALAAGLRQDLTKLQARVDRLEKEDEARARRKQERDQKLLETFRAEREPERERVTSRVRAPQAGLMPVSSWSPGYDGLYPVPTFYSNFNHQGHMHDCPRSSGCDCGAWHRR